FKTAKRPLWVSKAGGSSGDGLGFIRHNHFGYGCVETSCKPYSKEVGIYICGGKGQSSRNTPAELMRIGDHTGLDANYLVRCSKLSAKIDNSAIQPISFSLFVVHSIAFT
ncbi:MAG TPA: DUF763 domain-containing protein, partial [Daejeonella sp.]|nr:DUF763 domain-containing protein [Daejeonella sp.]